MPAKIRDNPDRIAFWTRHVAAWMRGPFTILEYCERHGLSRGQFSRWRQRLREDREREERIALMRKRRRRRISTRTKAISPSASVVAERLEQDFDAQLVRRRRRFTDDEKRHILGAVGLVPPFMRWRRRTIWRRAYSFVGARNWEAVPTGRSSDLRRCQSWAICHHLLCRDLARSHRRRPRRRGAAWRSR